ncbi:MAG: hypothetical protein R3B09_15490 [Nannocystaceae bacterium]
MSLPRAFAAMEALGCRLCDWRSLTAMLTGLEDRRRPHGRRSSSTASRTLLRDALASGEVWIEIDDTDDEGFDGAVARLAEESAVDVHVGQGPVAGDRIEALTARLDHLEGRLEDLGTRRRPRRPHADALEARLAALEARLLAVEASLREGREGLLVEASARDDQDLDAPVLVADVEDTRGDHHDEPEGETSPVSGELGAVSGAVSLNHDVDSADAEMANSGSEAPVEDVLAQGGGVPEGLDREPEEAAVNEELDARLWAAFHEFVPAFTSASLAEPTPPPTPRSLAASRDDRERRKKKQKDQRKQRKLARRR